jgi:hypothetical protein
MTSRDFCFWLQGMFELTSPGMINIEQTKIIKKHLDMVFLHEIDPSMGGIAHQQKLDVTHKPVVPDFPLGFPQGPGEPVARC